MDITKPDTFYREYTSQDAVLKYAKATAGTGITYLLDHDYQQVYMAALDALPPRVKGEGLRLLEFGCGAGMNLLSLVALLRRQGLRIDKAIGTDFSPVLIEAAKLDAKKSLLDHEQGRVHFYVANNDTLIHDLAASTATEPLSLANSYHFILGVNTIRYNHRAGTQLRCAANIFDLLVPGGVCVVIDMNNRFPFFRSALKNALRSPNPEECYLPSLDEYAAPFLKAGFELLRREHFCWIPHSSSAFVCGTLAFLSPLLTRVAKSRAMRSLLVLRKPLSTGTNNEDVGGLTKERLV